jgi:hypothetical protein
LFYKAKLQNFEERGREQHRDCYLPLYSKHIVIARCEAIPNYIGGTPARPLKRFGLAGQSPPRNIILPPSNAFGEYKYKHLVLFEQWRCFFGNKYLKISKLSIFL